MVGKQNDISSLCSTSEKQNKSRDESPYKHSKMQNMIMHYISK